MLHCDSHISKNLIYYHWKLVSYSIRKPKFMYIQYDCCGSWKNKKRDSSKLKRQWGHRMGNRPAALHRKMQEASFSRKQKLPTCTGFCRHCRDLLLSSRSLETCFFSQGPVLRKLTFSEDPCLKATNR